MASPNFFIIGAPKCGTTSLAHWLSEHPEVFFSPQKEPHHFNTDEVGTFVSRESYESLFEGANRHHLAIGEASTWYLHSQNAVPNIEIYNSAARYIVCLRNPVDMAPSLHEQKFFMGYEHIEDFNTAWNLRQERAAGHQTNKLCKNPRHLDYGTACQIGSQLKRLLHNVDRSRVLTIVLDDMKTQPKVEYQRTLSFLGLTPDGRDNFAPENTAKVRRFPLANTLMQYAAETKRRLGIERSFGLLGPLERKNIIYRARPEIPKSLRTELQSFFEPEVQILSDLLERDFSSWLKN
jgi:hypothetical protein